ncbi:hypothetical protein SKAU_G00203740 [Synaphobranchus kaupii]|uniref:Uncharacterized protein n=1 Tax=Synaphobranchus kaupii TaxID=118154 RepID=A0A9Q1IYM6_SYNKA|nr:hypothetical protein SKAU_G00203740 [Synaphobranchus kaupii]
MWSLPSVPSIKQVEQVLQVTANPFQLVMYRFPERLQRDWGVGTELAAEVSWRSARGIALSRASVGRGHVRAVARGTRDGTGTCRDSSHSLIVTCGCRRKPSRRGHLQLVNRGNVSSSDNSVCPGSLSSARFNGPRAASSSTGRRQERPGIALVLGQALLIIGFLLLETQLFIH